MAVILEEKLDTIPRPQHIQDTDVGQWIHETAQKYDLPISTESRRVLDGVSTRYHSTLDAIKLSQSLVAPRAPLSGLEAYGSTHDHQNMTVRKNRKDVLEEDSGGRRTLRMARDARVAHRLFKARSVQTRLERTEEAARRGGSSKQRLGLRARRAARIALSPASRSHFDKGRQQTQLLNVPQQKRPAIEDSDASLTTDRTESKTSPRVRPRRVSINRKTTATDPRKTPHPGPLESSMSTVTVSHQREDSLSRTSKAKKRRERRARARAKARTAASVMSGADTVSHSSETSPARTTEASEISPEKISSSAAQHPSSKPGTRRRSSTNRRVTSGRTTSPPKSKVGVNAVGSPAIVQKQNATTSDRTSSRLTSLVEQSSGKSATGEAC